MNPCANRAPGKPEATRVKVPPVELDGSRPKEMPGMRPRGRTRKRGSSEPTGHNESEPHLMSIEKKTTGEPSRCLAAKAVRGRRRQPSESCLSLRRCQRGWHVGKGDRVNPGDLRAWRRKPPTGGTTSAMREAETARAGVGVLHSSDEAPENGVERRRGSCADASEADRERGDGPQGIVTPTVPETATGVRKLQRTLYRQAKSKPKWKAWSLYGDVCRKEILEAALRQVIANGGAPGVDQMKVEQLKENPDLRQQWLSELREELRAKTYRPSPVRRLSKSRMREIRQSGSMRGSRAWKCKLTSPAPYSTIAEAMPTDLQFEVRAASRR